MNWNAWLQPPVITSLIIGIYGALLATATFVQNVRKNRRGWKIKTGSAFSTCGGPIFLSITFVNEGHRPITVNQMTVELPSRNWMASVDDQMPNSRLPITLSDSQSATVYFEYDSIRSALQRTKARTTKITPVVIDASSRVYRGNRIKMPVEL
jgi:hypothetical protein